MAMASLDQLPDGVLSLIFSHVFEEYFAGQDW